MTDAPRLPNDARTPRVRTFVQARMSSARFPGKVLAPFRGEPIVDHVVAAVRKALPSVPLVVATSDARSDDPLAAYLRARGVTCFRGPLEDVLSRFSMCLREHPCEYVLRVCSDSPLLGASVVRRVHAVLDSETEPFDLATTTLRRTFPRGSNVELINAHTLEDLQALPLSIQDREHVTRYLHEHAAQYRLLSIESGNSDLAELDVAVDTIEGLQRLERLSDNELDRLTSSWKHEP